eukprot:CAMPEP_0182926200 /NCGR_PEP_ID=MMETSP0105_2-20130417/11166_1 /TAXON_ID=81532 ORGANISM="Acanthoeca-like sp., Strain 10tr" /NCGR_SAMPLE_ID=MMETSP0105_2 /ASSEMBLY_ACC=CAM_ASM_000205 /LENGTH=286 /DNA_ID=CAMNT_0025064079 /DNA_START=212 /DNA_END=1072 /DNA_ORIENTATION=+
MTSTKTGATAPDPAPFWVKVGAATAASLVLLRSCFTIVEAGTVALVDVLGTVHEKVLTPGLHFVNPIASVHHFSIKTRNLTIQSSVPTNEGLNVEIDMSVLFKLNPAMVRDLYMKVGQQYEHVILEPSVRSVVRNVIANFEAKSLYSEGRKLISTQVQSTLDSDVAKRGIMIEEVLMRDIALPKNVSKSIELKLEMEQESQRMKFVLDKEHQEAERKAVEAKGIQDFQRIVSEGINDNLLRWKGIEATERLAESTNAKTVIFGNPADGLPVIMGGMQPGKAKSTLF